MAAFWIILEEMAMCAVFFHPKTQDINKFSSAGQSDAGYQLDAWHIDAFTGMLFRNANRSDPDLGS